MKKVIIAVFAVATAAVAAQAQGVARDFNEFGRMYLNSVSPKKEDWLSKQIHKEIEKQDLAHARAMKKKADEAKKQESAAQAAQPAQTKKTETQVPSYYYGREGKLLALSDRAAQVVTDDQQAQPKQSANASNNQQAAKKPAEQKKEEETYKGSFWGYLGFGPYPGETREQYRLHLESTRYASGQAFK